MGGVAEAWLRCLIGQSEVDTRRLRLSSVVCHPQKLIGEISTGHLRFLFGEHYTSISRVVIFIQNNPDIRLFVCCLFDYGPLLAYATIRLPTSDIHRIFRVLVFLVHLNSVSTKRNLVTWPDMAIDLPS